MANAGKNDSGSYPDTYGVSKGVVKYMLPPYESAGDGLMEGAKGA